MTMTHDCCLHQERRHANGYDILDKVAPQLIDASLQVKQFLLVREHPHLPAKCHRLRCNCGQSGTANAPPQPPHESYHQQDIHAYREQRGIHGMFGFTGGSQHGIHTEIHVRHHIAQKDDYHEFTGVWQRHVRGAKETQNGDQGISD